MGRLLASCRPWRSSRRSMPRRPGELGPWRYSSTVLSQRPLWPRCGRHRWSPRQRPQVLGFETQQPGDGSCLAASELLLELHCGGQANDVADLSCATSESSAAPWYASCAQLGPQARFNSKGSSDSSDDFSKVLTDALCALRRSG